MNNYLAQIHKFFCKNCNKKGCANLVEGWMDGWPEYTLRCIKKTGNGDWNDLDLDNADIKKVVDEWRSWVMWPIEIVLAGGGVDIEIAPQHTSMT